MMYICCRHGPQSPPPHPLQNGTVCVFFFLEHQERNQLPTSPERYLTVAEGNQFARSVADAYREFGMANMTLKMIERKPAKLLT